MLRHLLILLGGTAGAQAFTLLITPFLSRAYSPGDFGRLGVVLAASSVLAIALHGRLTLAIAGAGGLNAAWRVFICATRLNALLTFAFLVLAGLIAKAELLPNYSTSTLLFIPVFACLAAQIEVFSYWQSYRKEFNLSARNSIFRSVSTGLTQLGLSGATTLGMVYGALVGAILSLSSSVVKNKKEMAKVDMPRISFDASISTLKENRRFLLYSLPQGLVASASLNSVAVLLAFFFGAFVAGQYWLAYRILLAPIALIGGAYRQVVHVQLSDISITSKSKRMLVARLHTLALFAIAVPPVLLLLFWGQQTFEKAFGAQWGDAGAFSAYLVICFSLDFVKIPAITVLQSSGKQSTLLAYEVTLGVARVLAVLYFGNYGSAMQAVQAFSLVSAFGAIFIISLSLFSEKGFLAKSE